MLSEPCLPIRIGDDAALLALVPLASDMLTAKDQRLVLAAYRIRGMLSPDSPMVVPETSR